MTLSKLQEVKLLLSTTKFDIMGITETKFIGKIKDEELDIEGYKFVRKDRKKGRWRRWLCVVLSGELRCHREHKTISS